MILTGWKEISTHLRYGVRTVQRWERSGLPVRRVNGTRRSPVVADSDELDAWILRRITPPHGAPGSVLENRQRAQRLHCEIAESKKKFQLRMEQFKREVAEFRKKYRKVS